MNGFRTLIFNFLASLAPLSDVTGYADLIPQEYAMHYAFGVVIGNVVLRFMTKTPVFEA